jgi:5-methylcytosine-specific restriction enzyme subunit McrC
MPSIPVRNVYWMLCYAWNRVERGRLVDVGKIEGPGLVDLLAKVLGDGVERLIRRGLDRGYVEQEEETRVLRGRVDFAQSVKRLLLERGRAQCRFDELRHDILANQILKATIRRLVATINLNAGLRHSLTGLSKWFVVVTDIRLDGNAFERVQLHRNNASYDFLLRICRLVFENLVPEERGRHFRFPEIPDDPTKMGLLFQAFLCNFYRIEQCHYKVSATELDWVTESPDLASLGLLPRMRTDVVLRSWKRTLLIEAKYSESLQKSWKGPGLTLRTDHLYQLFAYLRGMARKGFDPGDVEGLLLYPQVDVALQEMYRIDGHPVRVWTIDLSRDWQDIHDDLLALIQDRTPTPSNLGLPVPGPGR